MKDQLTGLAKRKAIRQLIKYGLVGVVGLTIDMGIFYLLVNKFSVHYPFSATISSLLKGNMSIGMLDILISNIISQTLAVINNFILNSYFTFKVTDKKLKRFMSFASIAIVGMVISSMLLTLFIGIMKIDDMLAKVFAIFIVAAIQFAINKFFTFKEHEK
ncbi:GtrA family protein [Dysgonomonas termitidis]|uniref:GtrA family protein n=1 Tax=Dysgonomonas termitidis TaxID=1516126 RepID=A0ABV9KX07_9BACT